MAQNTTRSVDTELLRIGYLEDGPADGWPVILVHGYPYDVHAFDADAQILAAEGESAPTLRPWIRRNPLPVGRDEAKRAASCPRSRRGPVFQRPRTHSADLRRLRLGR